MRFFVRIQAVTEFAVHSNGDIIDSSTVTVYTGAQMGTHICVCMHYAHLDDS